MTAINHAVTGALIAVVVPNPLLAIPLALVSHLALDALPHFSHKQIFTKYLTEFQIMLVADILACLAFATIIFVAQPTNWWLIILCAFLATSPDFLWFRDFVAIKRHKKQQKPDAVRRFMGWIQWSQTPAGTIVEIIWFVAVASILFMKLAA